MLFKGPTAKVEVVHEKGTYNVVLTYPNGNKYRWVKRTTSAELAQMRATFERDFPIGEGEVLHHKDYREKRDAQ